MLKCLRSPQRSSLTLLHHLDIFPSLLQLIASMGKQYIVWQEIFDNGLTVSVATQRYSHYPLLQSLTFPSFTLSPPLPPLTLSPSILSPSLLSSLPSSRLLSLLPLHPTPPPSPPILPLFLTPGSPQYSDRCLEGRQWLCIRDVQRHKGRPEDHLVSMLVPWPHQLWARLDTCEPKHSSCDLSPKVCQCGCPFPLCSTTTVIHRTSMVSISQTHTHFVASILE